MVTNRKIENKPRSGALYQLSRYTKGWFAKVEDTEQVVTTTTEKAIPLDPALFTAAAAALEGQVKQLKCYDYVFAQTLSLIDDLVKTYPTAKSMLLSFCRNYLSFNDSDAAQIESAFVNLGKVHAELIDLC